MENSTPAYSWYGYTYKEDIPMAPKDKFTHLTQAIMVNGGQGVNEETYLTHNRYDIIQKFHTNAKDITHWILEEYQNIMALSIFHP